MARPRKIPPKLVDEVVAKSAEGWNATKIQAWLLSDHNIKIGDRGVQQLLKEIAEERKDVAKQEYAKAVSESANQDVSILGDKITKFSDEVDKALKSGEPVKAAKIAETLLKFMDRRMKLSGVDNEQAANDESILDNLMDKLGK